MKEKVKSIAAIDIGSNALRLLVNNYEDFDEHKALKKNAYIRIPLRLGEDVFRDGFVGEEKRKKLLKCLKAFSMLMEVYDVSAYRACATSAMREAKNGEDLSSLIEKHCGIKVDIISGEQEAELIFAAGSFEDLKISGDASYLHVDVGGGSTEVFVYRNRERMAAFSFPIGTLRILASKINLEDEKNFISTLHDIVEHYKPQDIVASGGNINKTLKLLGKKDGDSVPLVQVKEFYEEVSALNFEERLKKYDMNSYRADVIVPALKIFLTIGEICEINNFIIPKVGLVDGIIRHMYNGGESHSFPSVPSAC